MIADDKTLAYFSAQFVNKSTNRYLTSEQEQIIHFNNIYSKKMNLNEGEFVKITNIYRECSFANSITIGKINYFWYNFLVN